MQEIGRLMWTVLGYFGVIKRNKTTEEKMHEVFKHCSSLAKEGERVSAKV